MKTQFYFLEALLLITMSCLFEQAINAQNTFPATGSAGIGTTLPAASSALEIKSTTKGFLLPRMTQVQRNAIVSPAKGLVIYQITNNTGLYYYDGIKWQYLTGAGGVNTDLSNLTSPTAVNTSLLPKVNSTMNLGSTGLKWDGIYANQIHFGDGTVQSTSATGYVAGTGINIAGNTISNSTPDKIVSLSGTGGTTVSGTYPNFTINSSASNYTAGSGINITGATISNNAPDQVVSLSGTGSTTVSGTYPNFTINSAASNYTAGAGINITGTTISNNAPDQVVSLSGTGSTTVSGTYPNFTINSSASNYTAGSGIDITGTTISNNAPDQVVSLSGTGSTTVSGTYPNFTINSAASNYTAGSGINITGTTVSNTAPDQTVALNAGTGISVSGAYPNFTVANTLNLSSGDGIEVSGFFPDLEIANTAPDQVVVLNAGAGISVSGTYPNFTIASTVGSGANTSLSNLAATTAINTDLLPGTNNNFSLGSTTNRWRHGYINSLDFNDNTSQNTAFIPYTNGTGINISGTSIINTAPDKTVVLTGGSGISVSGTYPNFTIASTGGTSQWITNSSNIYYNTGNVGIGTSTPAYKLDIDGDINLSSGSVLRVNGTTVFKDDVSKFNVGVGDYANASVTTGTFDVATGYNALYANTAGYYNVATGSYALTQNTIGLSNTATGTSTLRNNTSGSSNTANGINALYNNTTGYSNVAIGASALFKNSVGNNTIAVGDSALFNIGYGANEMTAIGSKALFNNTDGFVNTACGFNALYSNTHGGNNTAMGSQALYNNTSGHENTATGIDALYFHISGSQNTAYGSFALEGDSTGTGNTGIGYAALGDNKTGSYNTALGFDATVINDNLTNATAIGAYAYVSKINSIVLGSIKGIGSATADVNVGIGITNPSSPLVVYGNTDMASSNVIIAKYAGPSTTIPEYGLSADTRGSSNGTGGVFYGGKDGIYAYGPEYAGYFEGPVLATTYQVSDEKLKTNINDYNNAIQNLLRLPVKQYNFKTGGLYNKMNLPKGQQVGILAQDVEKVYPNLIHDTRFSEPEIDITKKDKGDEIDFKAVNYTGLVPVLVKAVQELSVQNDQLKQQNNVQQKQISDLQNQFTDLKNTITQMQSAMGQCCSSFSSNMQSAISNQPSVKNYDRPELKQNIPNPFNGSCSIGYYIPVGFHTAQLLITDVAGHSLKAYSLTTPGYGNQIINGSELTQGMYQYSLLIDGKLIDTKKMEHLR